MRRVVTRLGASALASAMAAVVAVSLQAQQPAPAPAPNPLEDWKPEKLVNVQVLPNDITPDALIKVMREWNAALNVDCVFCHKGQVGKPWSTYDFTDDKKKRHEVARLMVKATTSLNEQFKDLGEMDQATKVSCATCHRRSRHPEIDLPPAAPKAGK